MDVKIIIILCYAKKKILVEDIRNRFVTGTRTNEKKITIKYSRKFKLTVMYRTVFFFFFKYFRDRNIIIIFFSVVFARTAGIYYYSKRRRGRCKIKKKTHTQYNILRRLKVHHTRKSNNDVDDTRIFLF